MAPLPVNATGRMWVDYLANGQEHSAMFRFPAPGVDGYPTEEFIDGVEAICNAVRVLMPTDYAILGTRVSAPGSTVSLPGPTLVIGAGTGTPSGGEAPAFLSFIGRSPAGRRVRVTFLGVSASPAQEAGAWEDYRVLSSENATVSSIVGLFNASPTVAIDGLAPTWYPYANSGYNAYWQRKSRG